MQYPRYAQIEPGSEFDGERPVAEDLCTKPVIEAVVSTAAPTFPSRRFGIYYVCEQNPYN